MDLQNSNPTILNSADLPSRRRVAEDALSTGTGTAYDSDDSRDGSNDDALEEPIDEQEIF
ncbi:hypothetical protein KEM56_007601, partial [Ascosphaera pollenicola]